MQARTQVWDSEGLTNEWGACQDELRPSKGKPEPADVPGWSQRAAIICPLSWLPPPATPAQGWTAGPDGTAGTCTVIPATLASKDANHGLCTLSNPIHHLHPIPGHGKAFPVISIQLEDTKKCPSPGSPG